jgi:6-phosphogluconolactonase
VYHDTRAFADVDDLDAAAAEFVAQSARSAVAANGAFHFAVSGGRTPWRMLSRLHELEVPWSQTVVYQVDERIAPPDDPARNLTHLVEVLGDVATIEPMPVNDADLEVAAASYGATLPERLDLVHLGLGPDGHTASLVPDDPVLDVRDRLVAVTGGYQGYRRMTLTLAALARAEQILWLVTGADKRDALKQLVEGDVSIPAGRVEAAHSLIMADRSAM